MNWPPPMTAAQEKRYDRACSRLKNKLGSYNNMALAIVKETDAPMTGQSVRNWFVDKKMPVQYAIVLVKLADFKINLYDLAPWLDRYFSKIDIRWRKQ